MLGITQSAALVGVDARPVQVEVNTGEAGELKLSLWVCLMLQLRIARSCLSRHDHRRSRWLQTNRDPHLLEVIQYRSLDRNLFY